MAVNVLKVYLKNIQISSSYVITLAGILLKGCTKFN